MTGNYTIDELSEAYKDFSQRLFDEIKALKQERESVQLSISTNRSNIKTLSGEKRDLFFVTDNEEYFKSVDSSKELEDSINALKLFREKGYTENTCIPGICDSIFNLQSFKDEIDRLTHEIELNDAKNIELKEKIDELEDLRTFRVLSIDSVRKYAHEFGFDSTTYRKIMLSYLRRGSKKNNIKKEEITKAQNEEEIIVGVQEELPIEDVIDNTATVEEVKEEEEFINPFENFNAVLNNPVTDEELLLNQAIEKETREIKAKYDELKGNYDATVNNYNQLLNDYYLKIESLKPQEKSLCEMYLNNSNTRPEDFENHVEMYCCVNAMELFRIKNDIDRLLMSIKDGEFGSLTETNELDIKVKSFAKLCDKLNLLNEKLMVIKEDEIIKNPSVFFYYNSDEKLDEKDLDTLAAFAKVAKYDQIDSFIEGRRLANENKSINTTLFLKRVNKKILTYIKLIVNDNKAIMVLNGTDLSNGYEEAGRIADSFVDRNSSLIRAEIGMALRKDPGYLDTQARIREELLAEGLKR